MTNGRCALGVVLALMAIAGCGDRDGASVPADGGTDAGPPLAAPPVPPAEPASPVLGPCPDGWRALELEPGVQGCDPWPVSGRAECTAVDEAHFPGEPGCARVGTACPSGDFPEGLPAGVTVHYVRAGAAAGGDGSLASPYATISEAMSASAAGSIVAVGKGRYDEAVLLRARVTLWGACVAETVLTSSVSNATAGVVTSLGADGVVKNLRIDGPARPGVFSVGQPISLEDVVVSGATAIGVFARDGASLTARNLVVRGTRPTGAGTYGRGVSLEGVTSTLDRVLVSRSAEQALAISRGSATLDRIAVVDAAPGTPSTYDWGLVVQRGASVEARAVVVEGNEDVGVVATGAGSMLDLEGAVIRDTRPRADGTFGSGMEVTAGASASVRRTLLERNVAAGVTAEADGATLELIDVVVRDTTSEPATGQFGNAMNALPGSNVRVTRALLLRNRDAAIFSAGSTLSLEDVRVADTFPRDGDDRSGGFGLVASMGAVVDGVRLAIDSSREAGVVSTGDATMVTLTDVAVDDTGPRERDDTQGWAFEASTGATLRLSRAVATRSTEVGVIVASATLVAEDLRVADTRGTVGALFGRGMTVQNGASGEVTRGVFERTRELGVAAFDPGTSVRLLDVVVEDVQARACADTTCVGGGLGQGLGAYGGATISGERFEVRRATLCGVHLATGGALDLVHGLVADSEIGACIQDAAFDVSRVQNDVRFVGNSRVLDATMLPVPTASVLPR